jgi:hypothetical protein
VARATKRSTVEALLARYGRTYADELGIDVARGTPSPLFRLLAASLLFSARIDSRIALEAARGLAKRGWRTAAKLAASSWDDRVTVLNEARYTRYQERTATMLGDAAEMVRDDYGGDLRQLRERARREPKQERKLLKELKGLGDVGVDIFFREVQVVWDEIAPFADRRALAAARRLGLGADAKTLARLAGDRNLARLVAALVRVELDDGYAAVRDAARPT